LNIALLLVLISAVWGFAIARTCWFAGDYSIGFSPIVLLAIPGALCMLILGFSIAVWRKSLVIGAIAILGVASIMVPLYSMHKITSLAWNRSLQQHSQSNQIAIQNESKFTACKKRVGRSFELRKGPHFGQSCLGMRLR